MNDAKKEIDVKKYQSYLNRVEILKKAHFVDSIELSVGDFTKVEACKDGIFFEGLEYHLYEDIKKDKFLFFNVDEKGHTRCLYHNEFSRGEIKELLMTNIIKDKMSNSTKGEIVLWLVLIALVGIALGGGRYIVMAFAIFIPFIYLYLRFKRLNSKIDYLIQISDFDE